MGCIRLGVIGCGGMSGSHLKAAAELAPRARITATADVVPERARQAAESVGAEAAVTDYRRMLPDVDAVLIALPHNLHHEVGKECLAAGKHVLMEKPLAITEDECLDLIHAAAERRLVLMTAYCMRFHPLVLRMKEILDAGTYGDVFQLSIWTEQHTQRPQSWYNTAKGLGGGQLISHGCHYIDLLLWFLGRPVKGYHLGTNYGTPWMEKEGTSHVAIEFTDGPLGYHFGTWGAKGTRLGYSFHAHCTEGMVEMQYAAGRLLAHTKAGEEVIFHAESAKPIRAEMSHFLDCVSAGARPLTDGPGSLQGLRVIWRLYEAEQAGSIADLRGLGLDEPWQ